MRFFVDQPVSPLIAEWLRSTGHDAVHVREREMSRALDAEIIALASAEQRIVITADLDFSRIVAISGADGPAVVLFRAGNITDDEMLALTQRVLNEVELSILSRAIVTVDAYRIRVAPLPLKSS